MRNIRILIVFIGIFFPLFYHEIMPVEYTGLPAAGSNILYVKAYILGFYMNLNGSFYVKIDANRGITYDDGTQNPPTQLTYFTKTSKYIFIPKDSDIVDSKAMLSQLLFAKALDYRVKFVLSNPDPADSSCNSLYYITFDSENQ